MGERISPERLQRAELARRTGCNLETVRYYEKVGLLPEPPRTEKGYRSYKSGHERRLRFVMRARELGFSLDEVRTLLRLVGERDQPCAEASRLASIHLADVQAKIADLRRMEAALAEAVARCGDGARPVCPLIELLSRDEDNAGQAATAPAFGHGTRPGTRLGAGNKARRRDARPTA